MPRYKKQSRTNKLINKFNRTTPLKKMLLFAFVFAGLGGGYYLYATHAATPPDYNVLANESGLNTLISSSGNISGGDYGLANNVGGAVRFSHDGNFVAYVCTSQTPDPSIGICINNANTDTLINRVVSLTQGASQTYWIPSIAWVPDDSAIVFSQDFAADTTKPGTYSTWHVNVDGSGLTQLNTTSIVSTGGSADGQISPDGTKIVFAQTQSNNVKTANIDFTNKKTLLNYTGWVTDPNWFAWSNDDSKLVYDKWDGTNLSLRTINADGTGDTQVAVHAGYSSYVNPNWWFDDSMLVFDSFNSANSGGSPYDIHTIGLDGSNERTFASKASFIAFQPLVHTNRYSSTDFNGDGKSDLVVYRPSNDTFYIRGVATLQNPVGAGAPTAGDFDGNGTSNVADLYNGNEWNSIGSMLSRYNLGCTNGLPVPADYDGDGKTDVAVYCPGATAVWKIRFSTTGVVHTFNYGTTGDIAVPGDYNGDGKADIAVFRPSNGTWYVDYIGSVVWGVKGDIPVPGDYNGDGKTDYAIWRPSTGGWYAKGLFSNTVYGGKGDVPLVGDFNGDGKTDLAVYRPSNGTWYVKGQFHIQYGTSTDIPLSLPYAIYHSFY